MKSRLLAIFMLGCGPLALILAGPPARTTSPTLEPAPVAPASSRVGVVPGIRHDGKLNSGGGLGTAARTDRVPGLVIQDRQWSGEIRPYPSRITRSLVGRMSITTFDIAPVPYAVPVVSGGPIEFPPAGVPFVPLAAAPPVERDYSPVPDTKALPPVETVLTVRAWTSGRFIDDDMGRRWILIYGQPDWSKSAKVSGWMLQNVTDNPHFFSRNGRLWRLQQIR